MRWEFPCIRREPLELIEHERASFVADEAVISDESHIKTWIANAMLLDVGRRWLL